MTVIFICTGNTCRSPMAEGIAKSVMPDYNIKSAGLAVNPNEPVSANAVKVMSDIGIDISRHTPTQLTLELAKTADYLVPMTSSHKAALISAGISADKILELDASVPDPYGGNLDIYTACRDKLSILIKSLSEKIR